jgi:hypothetical protein
MPAPPAPDDAAHRGGLSMRDYEKRVWDMAKHQLHPTGLFVLAQVVGATRLVEHPLFDAPGGWSLELALFLAGFLGAWACFYSTLLRVAGLRSLAVTVLVPLAALVAALVWLALPAPGQMPRTTLFAAAGALALPGVVGWVVTLIRWRAARREAASLLAPEARP